MNTESAIESEIQAKGLNAPRLTPALIDAAIVAEQHHVFPGTTLTVCCLTLRNGFTVTGESAAASPANFDEAIGRKIARENARQKVWALEGYLLRERLAADPAAKLEVAATPAELPRFKRSDDGLVVTDRKTGLEWSAATLPGRHNHADATKACTDLVLGDRTGWRLPTCDELLTLVDRTRHEPAIDVAAFPDTRSDWYWTSTPWSPSPESYAWFVDFSLGYSFDNARHYLKASVRAVRAPLSPRQ